MSDRARVTDPDRRSLALIGPGRAGLSVAIALSAAGWRVRGVAGRDLLAPSVHTAAARFGAVTGSAADVVAADRIELVIVACPDAAIGAVAAEIAPVVDARTLVIHLAGSVGLDALSTLVCRIGALHPLQTMPTAELGAARLAGSWCAIAGDPEVEHLARDLGMHPFPIADADRGSYHAAACIASNHLVALLAQVQACTTVPVDAFLPLVRATVDNVGALGPAAALTGPVARGDVETVRRHLDAIPDGERDAYRALARRAAVLAGRDPDLGGVLA